MSEAVPESPRVVSEKRPLLSRLPVLARVHTKFMPYGSAIRVTVIRVRDRASLDSCVRARGGAVRQALGKTENSIAIGARERVPSQFAASHSPHSLLCELRLDLLLVILLPGRSDTSSVDLWEAPRIVVQEFFPRPHRSQSAE